MISSVNEHSGTRVMRCELTVKDVDELVSLVRPLVVELLGKLSDNRDCLPSRDVACPQDMHMISDSQYTAERNADG